MGIDGQSQLQQLFMSTFDIPAHLQSNMHGGSFMSTAPGSRPTGSGTLDTEGLLKAQPVFTVLRSSFLLQACVGGDWNSGVSPPSSGSIQFDPVSRMTDSHIVENLLIKAIDAACESGGTVGRAAGESPE